MKFSANLGFLWTDRPLVDAIHAAKAAGFDAVECHWPYETPAQDVARALADADLHMISLNTLRGDAANGENGLAALPGRAQEAQTAIDQALEYAAAIGARYVHVMAGNSSGEAARQVFCQNIAHACAKAAPLGIDILIEPLNRHDAPGYFLRTTDQAVAIIKDIAAENLRLMFDCYHVQRTEGGVIERLRELQAFIGHIQFASVPDRGPPDGGTLDYASVFRAIAQMDYTAPLGAEYKPGPDTDATLGWLATMRMLHDG